MSWTDTTKNTSTFTNERPAYADMTWDEATMTWDDIQGTWDRLREPFTNADKTASTFANQSKS